MLITQEKSNMLIELSTLIRVKLGISIGYFCPKGSFCSENDDYLILEQEESDGSWTSFFLSKNEYKRESAGILVSIERLELSEPSETTAFINKIDEMLISGELYFDPGITRFVNAGKSSVKVAVSKTADNRFSCKVSKNGCSTGFCKTLNELKTDKTYEGKLALEVALELNKNYA